MSQGLVMEAGATPWGPGEEEAHLPLENKVANQDWALEGGADEQVWEPEWEEGCLSGHRGLELHPRPGQAEGRWRGVLTSLGIMSAFWSVALTLCTMSLAWKVLPSWMPPCPWGSGRPAGPAQSVAFLLHQSLPSFLLPLDSYNRHTQNCPCSQPSSPHWMFPDRRLRTLTITIGYILSNWKCTVEI